MLVGYHIETKTTIFLQTLKQNQSDVYLSTQLRNLGIVLNEILTLNYQNYCSEKKAVGVLIIPKKQGSFSTESLD